VGRSGNSCWKHAPRDPHDAAVLTDLDPELHGLVFGIPVGVPRSHGVLWTAALTRGSGSILAHLEHPSGRLPVARWN